jgi:hypothetical protein
MEFWATGDTYAVIGQPSNLVFDVLHQVNGRLVLEGPLRIHWEVQSSIKLAEKDESPVSKETWRRSYTIAMANGLDDDFLQVNIQ